MKPAAIVFDFDSTVVGKETLDEAISFMLAEHPEKARIVGEIEEITRLGMEGKLDFRESVRGRLGTVSVTRESLEKVGQAMLSEITSGMPEIFEWLRERNHEVYIVSGGFLECVLPVATSLRVPESHVYTNRMLFTSDGAASVDEASLLWTSEGKTPVLRALRMENPEHSYIMIGDGMNDYRAYESGAADEFVGFGAHVVRQSVKAKAKHFVHSAEELLHFLSTYL